MDDKKRESADVRVTNSDDKVAKRIEKVALDTRDMETVKYVTRKLADKGVIRMDRHPSDGTGIGRQPPKSGHGGKYTWEGPEDVVRSELSPFPPAVDKRDPNYVDEMECIVGDAEVEETVIRSIDVDRS